MKKLFNSTLLITSFAIFSMFFGAGNVVYPLEIGKIAQDKNFFAMLGFLLSSIGLLFFGLITMCVLLGNYKKFFQKIGEVPGLIFALILMGIIGPLGAIPRLIALSYSTINFFNPFFSLPVFSLISCSIIFVMSYKRTNIVTIIGSFLTPFLLVSLIAIIVRGLWNAHGTMPANTDSTLSLFSFGLNKGYHIMDMLATPFFSAIVIDCLRKNSLEDPKNILPLAVKSACIAIFMLAFIYIGLSCVASANSEILHDIPQEELISFIALQMLGGYGAIFASSAVALACLTTAIALTSVFAEFIHKDLTNSKISYGLSVVVTIGVSFLVSTLNFAQIDQYLAPFLKVLYPVLILLCFVNLYIVYAPKIQRSKG